MTTTQTKPKANAKIAKAQQLLNDHGFPCGTPDGVAGPKTAAAVRRFQAAFAGGRAKLEHLVVDGKLGAKTLRAVQELPYLSPHFTAHEARSRGNGECRVRRELLEALEVLRVAIDEPLQIRGMYRDPEHNDRVGGKEQSQHLQGLAADIWCRDSSKLRIERVLAVRQFSGIGDKKGTVLHVDVRHVSPKTNPTPSATPQRPARWPY